MDVFIKIWLILGMINSPKDVDFSKLNEIQMKRVENAGAKIEYIINKNPKRFERIIKNNQRFFILVLDEVEA